MDWSKDGCEACRTCVRAARWDGLALVTESIPRHARLWRCLACHAFWEEGEREAHVVSEDAARRDFPRAFD